jgi:hypothetical protein
VTPNKRTQPARANAIWYGHSMLTVVDKVPMIGVASARALMRTDRRRTNSMRHLPVMALLLLLSACQCVARVSVSGSTQNGPIIHVAGSSSEFTTRPILYDLSVYVGGTDQSGPIWHVKGKARVSSITYGKVPSGMSEETPPIPLEPGRVYSVSIEGDADEALFGMSCRGRVSFFVNSNGKVVPCPEAGSTCG